jgi:hypothetical protein
MAANSLLKSTARISFRAHTVTAAASRAVKRTRWIKAKTEMKMKKTLG